MTTTPGPGDPASRPSGEGPVHEPATGGPPHEAAAEGMPRETHEATTEGMPPQDQAVSPPPHEHAGPPAMTGVVGRDREAAPADRARRRAAARAFRSHRTLPATLVALLLAAAGIVTMVGAVTAAARTRAGLPALTWLAPLGRARWDDPMALTTAAVAGLLGIVLLIAAFKPGRPRLVALASEDPQTVTGITRSGLRRHLAAVAAAVDGVSRARVRLRRRAAEVTVATPLRDPGELPGEVGQAVEGRLAELRPLRPMRVRVAVRRKGG
ncbi:DUF6286 domain-containing protein [Sphaerisporangium rhizosphaerae]|uniref:DUF6286 domain-containing protein n=1 Tax=Sphaerisporangium rhizosphaerae TaxID=2269375 RepID=A0ABW2NVJ1_9ACTN